ncbi:hypothetical protein GCM10023116_42970 [Kistimonas scapharcae]|uniref:Uncharacterized protein n=1 Tax=Kistimonas scapharcae TaxID=1036133 RepID=A0ABP8V909_9GAMM
MSTAEKGRLVINSNQQLKSDIDMLEQRRIDHSLLSIGNEFDVETVRTLWNDLNLIRDHQLALRLQLEELNYSPIQLTPLKNLDDSISRLIKNINTNVDNIPNEIERDSILNNLLINNTFIPEETLTDDLYTLLNPAIKKQSTYEDDDWAAPQLKRQKRHNDPLEDSDSEVTLPDHRGEEISYDDDDFKDLERRYLALKDQDSQPQTGVVR